MKRIIILPLLFLLFVNIHAQLNLNKGTITPKKYFQELDVEFVNDKIIMMAEIGGVSSRFILDTGAPLCITEECQEKNQYKVLVEDSIIDANGIRHLSKIVNVDELKIGKLVYRNIPALVIDLEGSVLECFNTNGLIGSNLLRFGTVQIDWQKQKVIITNSYKKLGLKKKDSEKLLINDVQSSPYLTIQINAQITDRLLIDTGSNDFYTFSKKGLDYVQSKGYLKEAVLMESKGSASIGLFGANLKGSDKLVKMDSLTIGKIAHLHEFYTITTNDDQSRIGVFLLHQGLTTIDYPKKRFFFKLYNTEFKYEYYSFGFDLVNIQQKIIIGSIWINSQADKLGISVGDEIVDIEGFNMSETNLCDTFFRLKKFIQDKQSITLHIRKPKSGEVGQIKLNRLKL